MKIKEVIDLDKKYFMNTFGDRIPVCFDYGKGINIWDTEGKKYYDFFAGIAVSDLGHAHPKLVKAIKDQAEKFLHCSNVYYVEQQAKLAKLLVENSCADRIFFSNSGGEANEAAIKLARIYFYKKGISEKYEIITLKNSFHGRTLATVAATGQTKYQKPYHPLTPSFAHVPINDIEALKAAISPKTCAIMLEVIQGESGVHPTTMEYMQSVRKLCDDNSILLIIDEVQTGMGRTGKLFGYQNYGIEPDIFTLAKGIAGGVPMGAMCAKEHVAKAFEPGDHGSTFGGGPLACAAGLAVMDVLLNNGLVENAAKMGGYFKEKLQELKAKHSSISEVRGVGLMIGIQLSVDKAKEIQSKLMDLGYLVGSIGANVFRVVPPLIISKEDIDGFITVLDKVLSEYDK